MQKRILLIAFAIGVVALFIAGAYYIAVFLPQKQKTSMELTKLELEAKIEQEKTEQSKIEQEKQQQLSDEASKQADATAQQKTTSDKSASSNSSIKKRCNTSAMEKAREKYQEITGEKNTQNYVVAYYENFYNICLRENGL